MKNNLQQQNIPSGWQSTFIDDICYVMKGQGLAKKDIDSSGKNKCVLYGELFTTYDEVIDNVRSRTNSDTGIPSVSGDILIPGSTTTVAKDLAIASALNEDGVLLGGDINILRKKGKTFDSNFLAYYLTHYKNNEIGKLGQGTTIVHLYGNNLKNLEVIIPKSIKEQQKIAEILGVVDEDIAKTQEVIEATEKLKRGLMQQLFTRGIGHKKFKETKIGQIPDEWQVVKISDIGEVVTGNTPKTSDKNNYGDEYLFVSPKDIGQTKYIYNSESKLSSRGYDLARKIPAGSVLVVCIGSTIGKIALAGIELSTNQQINSVVVNEDFSNEFLYYQLLHRKKDIIGKRSTQAIPILNKTDFSEIFIASPKKGDERNKIVGILSAVDEKISMNKRLKDELVLLKKGLMQDLLSGKVRTAI